MGSTLILYVSLANNGHGMKFVYLACVIQGRGYPIRILDTSTPSEGRSGALMIFVACAKDLKEKKKNIA